MKRPEPDSPAARERSRAAAAWLVKRDRALTAEEQDRFLQWLGEDPRHGEWLALHRRTTGDFACLAQWRPEHSTEPNPDLLAPPRLRSRWFAPLVLAAAAGIAVTLAVWTPWSSTPRPTVARIGGYEQQILADGSKVELNRGAAIEVTFTPQERRVTLLHGEALFTVAKNPLRPFVVRAGDVRVRAIGTAFNVRLAPTDVDVLVTEGRIQLDPSGEKATFAQPPPLVDAGQRAVISRAHPDAPKIVAVPAAEIVQRVAWQPQLLDFSSVPLHRVLEEFNRRNQRQLRLADESLGQLPIIASVRSDNIEGLAHFLSINAGLRAETQGNEIILRRD